MNTGDMERKNGTKGTDGTNGKDASTSPVTGSKPAPQKTPPKKIAPQKTGPSRPYQRRRGGEARGISDLMPEIGRAAFRRFGFVQSSIVTRWPEIVGERYAAMSRPESISFPRGKKSDGTLNLLISGAQAVLMQHVEPQILERINRFFGYSAVKRIKMRHGALPVTPAKTEARPIASGAAPQLRPIPLILGDSLRDIGDPELLTVLQSLARSVADNDARKAEARRANTPATANWPPENWKMTGNIKPVDFTRFAKPAKTDGE